MPSRVSASNQALESYNLAKSWYLSLIAAAPPDRDIIVPPNEIDPKMAKVPPDPGDRMLMLRPPAPPPEPTPPK
jgi:hypothetical protein